MSQSSQPGSVAGSVKESGTSTAISGALVKLYTSGGTYTNKSATTGSNGSFQISSVDPGDYYLLITKSGYQDKRDPASGSFNVGAGEAENRGTFYLTPFTSDGRIACTRDQDILVMNADGSNSIQVTTGLPNDDSPAWSPGGDRLAFSRSSSETNGFEEIYTIRTDGTDLRRLTNSPGQDDAPAWAPTGARIAFHSERDGNFEIYVMNSDGSSQVRLVTRPEYDDMLPAWSPDGRKLAFSSGDEDAGVDIWIMDPDGTDIRRLTVDYISAAPAWSPDGSKIAFHSFRDGNMEIYIMNSDGSNQTRLTSGAGSDKSPSWSSDGQRIVYTSDYDIWIMNKDGTSKRNITNTSSTDEWAPTWGPN